MISCRFAGHFRGRGLQRWFSMAGSVLLMGGLAFAKTEADDYAAELAGKPVVGRNANGQLEVFMVGRDGVLRHRRQNPSDGDWSPWLSLGGDVLPGIAVANDTVGEMQIFAVDRAAGTLWKIGQEGPNSGIWSAWTNFGGSLRAPVTAAQNRDGRLEIFGVGLDGTVQHLSQNGVA